VRDPRGFAVKFDMADGNWGLAGTNTPVSFRGEGWRRPPPPTGTVAASWPSGWPRQP